MNNVFFWCRVTLLWHYVHCLRYNINIFTDKTCYKTFDKMHSKHDFCYFCNTRIGVFSPKWRLNTQLAHTQKRVTSFNLDEGTSCYCFVMSIIINWRRVFKPQTCLLYTLYSNPYYDFIFHNTILLYDGISVKPHTMLSYSRFLYNPPFLPMLRLFLIFFSGGYFEGFLLEGKKLKSSKLNF
jgi:hypothetical protein